MLRPVGPSKKLQKPIEFQHVRFSAPPGRHLDAVLMLPPTSSDVYSCRLSSFLTDYRKDLRLLTAYSLPQGRNLTAACRLPQLDAYRAYRWIPDFHRFSQIFADFHRLS